MTSDGREGGDSAESDFISSKVAIIKHLMRGGGGGSKNGKNHLTSYMDGPLCKHFLLRKLKFNVKFA